MEMEINSVTAAVGVTTHWQTADFVTQSVIIVARKVILLQPIVVNRRNHRNHRDNLQREADNASQSLSKNNGLQRNILAPVLTSYIFTP